MIPGDRLGVAKAERVDSTPPTTATTSKVKKGSDTCSTRCQTLYQVARFDLCPAFGVYLIGVEGFLSHDFAAAFFAAFFAFFSSLRRFLSSLSKIR